METMIQQELFQVERVARFQPQEAELFQVAEVELHYKSHVKPSSRPVVRSSRDAYNVFLRCWDLERIELVEQFKVLFVNQGNRVLGMYEVSTGGITGTVADPRLIFAAALKAAAVAIFVAHSHPSGNLRPSRADEALTAKLKQAGLLLDITVFDHLILTTEDYFSFADSGLL
jgi:DNA repair protein RadC